MWEGDFVGRDHSCWCLRPCLRSRRHNRRCRRTSTLRRCRGCRQPRPPIWTRKDGSCWPPAGGQTGSRAHARHELQPEGAQPQYSIGRQQSCRPALFSARGPHHRQRDRPAVPVVAHVPAGLRQGPSSRSSTSSSTTRTSQASPRRRHAHHLWTHVVLRTPREQRAVEEDGRTLRTAETVQLMMIMGDYFRVGFMINAIDQHLPPERKALLPPLNRSPRKYEDSP